ncbi:MAG: hypothetical protein LBG14_04665 [Treponema sp.]|nr:hypothetical protein [Treponema sp.]
MDNAAGTPEIIYAGDQCVVVNKRCGEAVEGAGKGMIDLPSLLQSPAKPQGGPGIAVFYL